MIELSISYSGRKMLMTHLIKLKIEQLVLLLKEVVLPSIYL